MWRAATLASLLAVPGCDLGSDGCPPARPFTTGTYDSAGGSWANGTGKFPHDGPPKMLTLERLPSGEGSVRVTYVRGGKTIVERWAMPKGLWSWRAP